MGIKTPAEPGEKKAVRGEKSKERALLAFLCNLPEVILGKQNAPRNKVSFFLGSPLGPQRVNKVKVFSSYFFIRKKICKHTHRYLRVNGEEVNQSVRYRLAVTVIAKV